MLTLARISFRTPGQTPVMPLRGLFVTGTDTGVGKTFVAVGLVRWLRARGYRTGAYKPVASGCREESQRIIWDDVESLHAALNCEFPQSRICPQTFRAPLAPPVAAQSEGRAVDTNLLREGAAWWSDHADVLIVEGAGGLLSPISDRDSVADLARDLGWPLLIVARAGLGTINHTLLTIEAADRRRLPVAGVVLNPVDGTADPSAASNPLELANRCSVPILAVLSHSTSADLLQQENFRRIDWYSLCQERGYGVR